MTRYVEFAVTSNFSFLHGASHPEELIAEADRLQYSGLGLCDRNSVAGVVRAHLAKRETELKLRYHPGARLIFRDGTPDILAYPRDRAGWGKLCRLLTCIREHITLEAAGRRLAANSERYLKPPTEMARMFRDHPQAIEETRKLS